MACAKWAQQTAISGKQSGEELWYTGRLHIVEIESGNSRQICTPKDQLGSPTSPPSAKHLVILEAVCSDRWIVAGECRDTHPCNILTLSCAVVR